MRLGLISLCVLSLAGCTSPEVGEPKNREAQASGTAPSVFGAQAGNVPNVIQAARDAKVSWMRYHLDWDKIEATQGTYDFSAYDGPIAAIAQSNTPLIYIFGTPTWARQPGREAKRCGPIDAGQEGAFRAFVRAAVQRYQATVKHWEFWNEPDAAFAAVADNHPFGCWGEPTQANYGGEYYASFLRSFYQEVKAVDPGATVLLGGQMLDCDADPGSCTDPGEQGTTHFVIGVLEQEAAYSQSIFDVLAYHGYAYYNTLGLDWERRHLKWQPRGVLLSKADYLRQVMRDHGYQKRVRPLLMNEGGLIVGDGCTVTRPIVEAMANEVWRLYNRTWAAGLLGAVWYTLDAPGWRCSGLLNTVDGISPYQAFSFLANTLTGTTQVFAQAQDATGIERYAYCDKATSTRFQLYWSVDTLPAPVTIQAPASGYGELFDMLGNKVAEGVGLSFQVGFQPVLLRRTGISARECDPRIFLPLVHK